MDLINKLFCRHKNTEVHITVTESQHELLAKNKWILYPETIAQVREVTRRKHITTVICKDCMMIKQKVINLD